MLIIWANSIVTKIILKSTALSSLSLLLWITADQMGQTAI